MTSESAGVPGGRWWVLVVVLLAAVLLVAAAFAWAARGGSGDGSKDGIVVSGRGSVSAVPDQAVFTVGVRARAATVEKAMGDLSAALTKVTRALRDAGVDEADLRTENLDVSPTYDYSKSQETITGYAAQQDLRVKVRVLAAAGKAISAAAHAGGNAVSVTGFRLTTGDRSHLLAQARSKAVKDARKRAEQYAEAADRSLGEVVFVQEELAETPRPLMREFSTADSAGSTEAVPISPGSQRTTVHVTVRFRLG